jgi:hypothetical protein
MGSQDSVTLKARIVQGRHRAPKTSVQIIAESH